jgi:hypothetical protein
MIMLFRPDTDSMTPMGSPKRYAYAFCIEVCTKCLRKGLQRVGGAFLDGRTEDAKWILSLNMHFFAIVFLTRSHLFFLNPRCPALKCTMKCIVVLETLRSILKLEKGAIVTK